MLPRRHLLAVLLALSLIVSVDLPSARAFIIFPDVEHWLTTASGSRPGNGSPATLTWSLVPDGTSLQDAGFGNLGASNLIEFLDTEFGGDPNNEDLSERPWFQIFADAFGRWGELSGATYIYEPNDDGAATPSSSSAGALGVRGDIRIAGASIDGSGGANNVLAFNNFPQNGGDMVLDTDDGDLFDNPANDFRYLRNTLMHEHGHGFGVRHVSSSTDQLLMEPSINPAFDGPQLDEVRAIQYYFGDANEKSHGGLGNGTSALATSLGAFVGAETLSVGSDADVPDQAIDPTAVDFVSIANLEDVDFYSFTISQHSKLTATLTPRGGQFTQAAAEGGGAPTSFDADARSDLSLAIFDTNGATLLDLANDTGLGGVESILNIDLALAGQYFARITGAQDTIQMYELELSVIAIQPADFDEDGDVDGDDLAIWEAAYGASAVGDADDDGDTDGEDFLVWQQQYTGELSPTLAASRAVPEPGALALFVQTALTLRRRRNAR